MPTAAPKSKALAGGPKLTMDSMEEQQRRLSAALPVVGGRNSPSKLPPTASSAARNSSLSPRRPAKNGDGNIVTKTKPYTPSAFLTAEERRQRALIPTPGKQQRITDFGIDCCEVVHFNHWEPGGEYVKHIVIKNVVMKTQKIRYALPTSTYFSMDFPETKTLSAGMSWTVPITFRPVAKECYDDCVEFTTSLGKFFLPVRATIPEHVLTFPQNFDFAYCPVRETAKRTFTLRNSGQLESAFHWEILAPFDITPRTGTLKPGESMQMTADFSPKEASVFRAKALCRFGGQQNTEGGQVVRAMEVTAVGKFSHLYIDGGLKSLDFGPVYVGKSAEKTFVLKNESPVTANFKIRNAERDLDPYFSFSLTSGSIPSKGSLEVKVTYTPVAAALQSSEYYDIVTVSGNTTRLTCLGMGMGPQVVLTSAIANFGDIEVGKTSLRSLHIQNNSASTAFYQFLVESTSTFRIDKIWGTIAPYSSAAINIRCVPTEPINYHRRVYCLIENQDALYVDLLASGFNDKRRPATFLNHHLDRYHHRVQNGLHLFPPEQLEDMLRNGYLKLEEGKLHYVKERPVAVRALESCVDKVSAEYFHLEDSDTCELVVLNRNVDFGSCSRRAKAGSKTIRVQNNTKGKVTLVWMHPASENGDAPVFTVSPQTQDVLPKSVVEFQVNFQPNIDNSFFGVELECYAFFKTMRSFRLVNEETFTPPWCLTMHASGNTFPPGQDTFLPKIQVHNATHRLDFPGCRVHQEVYRTIRVSNEGDTPVKFAFATSAEQLNQTDNHDFGQGFSVKPRFGLLAKNQSQLIVFKFSPAEQQVYEQTLKCFFNNSTANEYEVVVHGVGYLPAISLDIPDDQLIFRPTAVRGSASQTFVIRNKSRIPVSYEWRVPEAYAQLISIQPPSGRLLPNAIAELTCSFAPTLEKTYAVKIPVFYGDELISNELGRKSISVVGRGTQGTIYAESKTIEFNNVLVNTQEERHVQLFNPSDCDVKYHLELTRVLREETETNAADGEAIPVANEIVLPNQLRHAQITVNQTSGIISSRSHQIVKVRVGLRYSKHYEFRLYCKIEKDSLATVSRHASKTTAVHQEGSIRTLLCTVTADGVFPSLQITDARSEGHSKNSLWHRLSLMQLNEALSSHDIREEKLPTPLTSSSTNKENIGGHVANALARKKSDSTLPATFASQSYLFDFGAQIADSPETIIHVCLENTGVVSVEWSLALPSERDVDDKEGEANSGDYTDEQIQQNFIVDNHLYSISPKRGSLAPKEKATIALSYRHGYVGSHRMPIILNVKNGPASTGKRMTLLFSGTTVPATNVYLHVPSNRFSFMPVPIGERDAPVQVMTLQNCGLRPVDYEIDTSVLTALEDESPKFNVVSLLSPKSGTIFPGSVQMVNFIFRPIAVQEYTVNLPIMTSENKTILVKMSGKGLPSQRYRDAKKLDPRMLLDDVPCAQVMQLPQQLVYLSRDRINFGEVPVGCLLRGIVIVHNTSKRSVSFRWMLTDLPEGLVSVEPVAGPLKSGQSAICRLVYQPSFEPRIYETDVCCEIMDEDEAAAYHNKLALTEQTRREYQMAALDGPSRQSIAPRPSSPSSLAKSGLNLNKYSTLPPIRVSMDSAKSVDATAKRGTTSSSAQTSSTRRASTKGGAGGDFDVIEVPVAPETEKLYVTVVATTRPADEYRNIFDGSERFFFNARQVEMASSQDMSDLSGDCVTDIRNVLLDAVDDIVCELEAENFVGALTNSDVPIFQHLSQRPSDYAVFDRDDVDNTTSTDFLANTSSFKSTLEEVLESTILNLMREAVDGEFSVVEKPAYIDMN